MPKPNSARVPTLSICEAFTIPLIESILEIILSACPPPEILITFPFSTRRTTGSSTISPSRDPSITIFPFAEPSLGRTKTFPVGRFVICPGLLQIPLSSNIHLAPVLKVKSVPEEDFTLTEVLFLSNAFSPEISFFIAP